MKGALPMKSKDRVAKIRKIQGLTQKQVAEKAGLTVRAVQNYELIDRQPKGEFLSKLAKGLGVPESALLSDEGFNRFMVKRNKSRIVDAIMGDANQKGVKGLAKLGVGLTLLGGDIALQKKAKRTLPLAIGASMPLVLGSALPLAIASLIGIGGISAVRAAIDKSKHIDSILKAAYREMSRVEGLIVLINDKMSIIRHEYEQRAISMQQEDLDVADHKEFIQLSHLISTYQAYLGLLEQKRDYCSLLISEIEENSGKTTKMLNELLEEISNIEKHEHELADVIMKTTKGLSDMD